VERRAPRPSKSAGEGARPTLSKNGTLLLGELTILFFHPLALRLL
jgi:hypothetical protein